MAGHSMAVTAGVDNALQPRTQAEQAGQAPRWADSRLGLGLSVGSCPSLMPLPGTVSVRRGCHGSSEGGEARDSPATAETAQSASQPAAEPASLLSCVLGWQCHCPHCGDCSAVASHRHPGGVSGPGAERVVLPTADGASDFVTRGWTPSRAVTRTSPDSSRGDQRRISGLLHPGAGRAGPAPAQNGEAADPTSSIWAPRPPAAHHQRRD